MWAEPDMSGQEGVDVNRTDRQLSVESDILKKFLFFSTKRRGWNMRELGRLIEGSQGSVNITWNVTHYPPRVDGFTAVYQYYISVRGLGGICHPGLIAGIRSS